MTGMEASVVPDSIIESANRTLSNLEELKTNLLHFLSLSEPQVLSQVPPLQRAQAFLVLAKALSALFTVRLRCNGVNPDDHAVKSELERLSLYEDKFERYNDWSKEPLRPSAKLNYQAATRFIEHSLPDLSPEQKQSMRNISRGEGAKSRLHENQSAQRKRKHPSSGKQQSVQAAAQEFLEKARRELLSATCDVNGPLRNQSSDEEDLLMG
ncbi:hypothetical protein MRB53_013537 [Persea americana]|uniref:Uncharacterized protein n=1 Tax=Persea americana TaxID=3435 RepID=A0ACC2K8B9_PERAE|nr:hypothetical protein MRB53_013537 [Persea americana]